jgi:hypothetical protein
MQKKLKPHPFIVNKQSEISFVFNKIFNGLIEFSLPFYDFSDA